MFKAYATQKLHDSVRTIVRATVERYPGILPDTLQKRLVYEVSAGLPGAIKSLFPDKENLNFFSGMLIREIIQEMNAATHEGSIQKERPCTIVCTEPANELDLQMCNDMIGFLCSVIGGHVECCKPEDAFRMFSLMKQLSKAELERLSQYRDEYEMIAFVCHATNLEDIRKLMLTRPSP
jgi:pentatricopeptide repeat protein